MLSVNLHAKENQIQKKEIRMPNNLIIRIISIWHILFLFTLFSPTLSIFADVYVTENITSDTLWTKSNSPYIVDGDIYVRYSNYNTQTAATLEIEAGTIVKFTPGSRLYVGYYDYYYRRTYYGALKAQGDEIDPITFTSNASSPQPGDWDGIYFTEATDDTLSVMEHCIVEYGGQDTGANIRISNTNPNLLNNIIRLGSMNGITNNGSGRIENNIIEDNLSSGINETRNSSILNNIIRNNGSHGIYSSVQDVQPIISGNQLENNTGSAIIVKAGNVHNISDNFGTGNGEDFINISGGGITTDLTINKLSVGALPWIVTGMIVVSSNDSSLVTLSIKPGATIRFGSYGSLYIGYSGLGALIAQGRADDPILFTSNASSPSPGDWEGIYFNTNTDDNATIIENCIVEYGGKTNYSNIYCMNAKPTIQYNIIRNSSYAGVYINGTGSSGAIISCNEFSDNGYGIININNASPLIEYNNFINSETNGIRNLGSAIVAENNWWGDANGPGYDGDNVYGDVDVTPFLTEQSDCVDTPPTNLPPNLPEEPSPEDGAVEIPVSLEGIPIDVNLTWTGGDRNPWDTVVYDLYFGEDPGNLLKIAENLNNASYALSSLESGTQYYWKIVSRDEALSEVQGPVWSFITLGDPPDLVVTNLSWDMLEPIPAGSITFTATIENDGTGPVVDSFYTRITVIGHESCSINFEGKLAPGENLTLSCTIENISPGDYDISAEVDTEGVVNESDEDNNILSLSLPTVYDLTPPELYITWPVNGTTVAEASAVNIQLIERPGGYNNVDFNAVINSIEVRNSAGDIVSGEISSSNGEIEAIFTFTPDIVPMYDDTYTVSLTAFDLSGNSEEYSFSFTVDCPAPAIPRITGGDLLTGIIQVRPFENQSNTSTITLTGTRDDNSSLWINNEQKQSVGSGNWSVSISLSQGHNAFEIWLQDISGAYNSPSVWVDICVDSNAPEILGVVPTDNSLLNTIPENVTILIGIDDNCIISGGEGGEGEEGEEVVEYCATLDFCFIDYDNSIRVIRDSDLNPVSGTWSRPGNDFIFTPSLPFSDGIYTVDVILVDQFANTGLINSVFEIDTTRPTPPVVNPVTSPWHNSTQEVTGTKETNTSILINDIEVISNSSEIVWDYPLILMSGENLINFKAKDRAGNISEATTVNIFYDDIPPLPVSNLQAINVGDGASVNLNWVGYDENLHGDINHYKIYQYTAEFNDVTGMMIVDSVLKGTFTYPISGLTKGNTYWFAVVAVDNDNQADNAVSSVQLTIEDTIPPESITSLQVTSNETNLYFEWEHSADTAHDLSGYRVSFSGNTEDVILPKEQAYYEATGLSSSTGYSFAIYAVDADGNNSPGVSINASTLLNNPTNLAAAPHDGYVTLTWSGAEPSDLVQYYRIYQSVVPGMTDVAEMTFRSNASGLSKNITGLENGTIYYFAVTTVNISNGERQSVTTVSATPLQDIFGPIISNISFGGSSLADGFTVSASGNLAVTASDAAGISRVEFYLDGSLIKSDGSSPYTCAIDPLALSDGSYALLIKAYDTFSNVTEQAYTVQIALVAPPAPVISQPVNNSITNNTSITVSGSAQKESTITLFVNEVATTQTTATTSGTFSTTLNLVEGENQIKATATNRGGISPDSAARAVTLDTTLPQNPLNLAAQSKAAGKVSLTWQAPSETQVKGFNIYRAEAPFTEISSADKINSTLITVSYYTDLPVSDGTYYYRVATVDTADNESELSDIASADSDNTPPRATTISYAPQGNVDADTGAMAPGKVDLVLTVNEPLSATPFLSITPEGGVPMNVVLSEVSDLEYSGEFEITEGTVSTTAWAVFSARDMVGNRGTEIDAGQSILIDTDGPAITRISITPVDPVKNDETEPVTLSVVIGLNEAVKDITIPELFYRLSATVPDGVSVDSLTETTPEGDEVQAWQAQFTLPATAGLADAETLSFEYQAQDLLDNISNEIACINAFQVFQGDLPPLEAPTGLTAKALPGGEIILEWNDVDEAVGYQLYRQGPGDTELLPYGDALEDLEYTDTPIEEGTYYYAVASIREVSGEQSLSGLSNTVEVVSDATAPEAPTDFALELVANGILATWVSPSYSEDVTFCLYRSDAAEITSVEGLSPVVSNIPMTSSQVVDPSPSLTDHCYVVTAVDASGNESAPSNYDYLNFTLLPVSGITVVQTDDEQPVITWTHPDNTGNVEDFDFSINGFDPERLSVKTYTDSGYVNDVRTYSIIAVDQNESQSLARSITLPVIHTNAEDGAVVQRGIMNSLSFHVENLTDTDVDYIRLKVNIGGYSHTSAEFNLAANSETVVPVVIGGYDDLDDVSAMVVTTEITPNTGEKVRIIRTSDIDVMDGALNIGILNEEFIRGGTGEVRFTLENTGEENIEIVTAQSFGNQASSDIRFKLLDEDNNVLSVAQVQQAVGDSVLTLSSGPTIVRIAPGEVFTSEPVTLTVPSGASDDLVVQLQIDHIYHHLDQSDEIVMQGMGTTLDVTLTETSYYAEVTALSPETSIGDVPIVISGQAVERATESPIGNVPVKLIISLNGFERTKTITTDDAGQFTYEFTPNTGESGIFKVMALHPDLTDRTVQGQFVITSIAVTPTTINVQIPKNYEQTLTLKATAGKGTCAENLRVVYEADDQPNDMFIDGIHVTLADPVSIGSAEKVNIPIEIWGDNIAPATGKLAFKVISDESGDGAWATVIVNLVLEDATPALYYSPNYVETGLSQTEQVTETITLENKGLADLEGMQLSLVNQDGGDMPDWVAINSSTDQGTLAVGERRNIDLSFFPDETVSEGIYSFYLRVTADNYATRNIGIYVSVTQSGIGNALFKVSDIYTGTPDTNTGLPIQGLVNARVRLQNEEVLTEEYSMTTDSLGEAFFEDLPSGNYKARIRADNHQEKIVRIWIKPGVTTNQEIFLDYNLVTVEWEVNEVTLQDTYEIVLTATYVTDVPAAVVVAEPASVTLPDMEEGDTYNIEITLTNHGLIRADNLTFTLPTSDEYYKYETLETIPTSIAAKEKITIPYRVTCLTPYGQSTEASGGGDDCTPYNNRGRVEYDYCCANGNITKGGLSVYVNKVPPNCGADYYEDPETGGMSVRPPEPMDTGDADLWSPPSKAVEGTKCYKDAEQEECEDCKNKDSEGNQRENIASYVNVKYRTYSRDDIDLSVKTAKGNIEVKRYYHNGQWYIGTQNYNFLQTLPGDNIGSEGTPKLFEFYYYEDPRADEGYDSILTTIIKNGVAYKLPGENFALVTNYDDAGAVESRRLQFTGPQVYLHKSYTISYGGGVFLWKDKNGGTHKYSEDGVLLDSGDAGGGRTKYIYGIDGRITGIETFDGEQLVWFEYNTSDQLSVSRLSDGRQTEYFYTEGLLTHVVDVTGEETFYQYDDQNRLNKVVDANGNEKNITYGDQDEVIEVKDQEGIGHEFEYDYDDYKNEYYARTKTTSGRVKEVWLDDEGRTKRISINGRIIQEIEIDGRIETIADENGYETVKEYDEWDNLIKITYPNGTEVINEYEHDFNRLIKKTDENGVITTYDYDTAGNLISKTEAVGTDDERTTEYTYDDYGNILTITVHGDSEDFVTTMTYDDVGNLATIEDPENNLTQFTEHDIMGNVLTKIDANNKTWSYTYDDAGRLLSVTDPLTRSTSFEYDAVGNKTKEIDARGIETVFEYDNRYNLTEVTQVIDLVEPDNNPVTTFEYNNDNKMTRQVDPEGNEVIYEYDNEGHLLRTIDGNGNEINMEYSGVNGCSSCSGGSSGQLSRIVYPTFEKTFVYDKRGRKVSEDDILDAETTYRSLFRYDDAGNLVSKTDKEGKTTFYGYDNLSRLKHVFDPEAGETYYAYDDRDNLVSLTDAESQTTQFEYNKNNQLVKEIRPMLEETTYDYDSAGNLIEKIDAKDQKTTYVYDDAGRLEEINYFAASADTEPAKTVTFTYDEIGNLTGYDDGTTSATYGYDDLYRKISESVNYGAFAKTNAYTYLKNGLKETYTGSDDITYGYLYDSNNQLTGVQVPNLGFITINEYSWNRPASMTLPGGTTKNFSYDPLMRIKQIETKDPGQNVLLNYQYNYDKMDNITSKDTEHGAYGYDYDDLYRLKTVDNPVQDDEAFTYDLVGNRLTAADTDGNWTYNGNNELVTSAPSSAGTTGETTFDYDANGNMIQKTVDGVVTSYVYNIEDRLTQIWNGEVDTGSLTAEYYYDPFGRRLWKEVSGVRTYFHYADEGLVAEIDAVGTETKTYGYKPGSTWTTDPLFMKVGTEYYFYHNDHLGTPQKITAVNGTIVWDAKYSSFGEATIEVEAVENNLRFPGQYYDRESGLHYNFWRYYDPSTGRYCRTDTIGIAGGINVYLYVMNNTLKYTDPSGEIFLPGILIGFVSDIAIQIGTQLIANGGRWECIDIDWTSAIISGAIGGFAPGIFTVGKKFLGLTKNFKKIKKARKVVAAKRHRAFKKLADGKPKPPKYERRLHRNTKKVEDEIDDFADTTKALAGYQMLKAILKSFFDNANNTKASNECPCPN